MKKLLAFFMAVMMLMSLTACGGGGSSKSSKESKKTIVGVWEADLAFEELLEDQLAGQLGTDAEYFNFSKFAITMTVEFNKDETYAMYVSEDAAEDAVDQILEILEDGMVKYLEAEIVSNGLDMSVDELLALSGMTMDDFMTLMEEEMGGDEFVDELVTSFSSEGNYKAEDGKLYLSDGYDNDIDEEVYEEYELKGSKLILTESVGVDSDSQEYLDMLYPLEFKRVK